MPVGQIIIIAGEVDADDCRILPILVTLYYYYEMLFSHFTLSSRSPSLCVSVCMLVLM